MRIVVIIVLCANLGLLAGCTNSEGVYGNIYEGFKIREAIVHPTAEQKPAEKSISYQGYEAERKKLLESDDKK
ncbi:MAG: hypothetical protein PHC94_03830 [Methylobacter sp.]|nr:hypothetical protein [Methylobacter sp.]